jgi:GTP-binding protein
MNEQVQDPGSTDADAASAPVLAVVGRPNVGKSTLVNRMLGSRQAVVEDTPGVTRDRVAYDGTWRGRAFTIVDTGGWDPAVEGSPVLAAKVAAQARLAVDAAERGAVRDGRHRRRDGR